MNAAGRGQPRARARPHGILLCGSGRGRHRGLSPHVLIGFQLLKFGDQRPRCIPSLLRLSMAHLAQTPKATCHTWKN